MLTKIMILSTTLNCAHSHFVSQSNNHIKIQKFVLHLPSPNTVTQNVFHSRCYYNKPNWWNKSFCNIEFYIKLEQNSVYTHLNCYTCKMATNTKKVQNVIWIPN